VATNTGLGTASAASTTARGQTSKGFDGAPGGALFEPSPGRSTSQIAPGTSSVAASSRRLSEPIPGPPGKSSQLRSPARSECLRRRTPEGVNSVFFMEGDDHTTLDRNGPARQS